MQEMADSSKSLDRTRETWQEHGYSEKWIQQRMMGQETRNKLTDYWKENGIEQPSEFAILTNCYPSGMDWHQRQRPQKIQGIEIRKPTRSHERS